MNLCNISSHGSHHVVQSSDLIKSFSSRPSKHHTFPVGMTAQCGDVEIILLTFSFHFFMFLFLRKNVTKHAGSSLFVAAPDSFLTSMF